LNELELACAMRDTDNEKLQKEVDSLSLEESISQKSKNQLLVKDQEIIGLNKILKIKDTELSRVNGILDRQDSELLGQESAFEKIIEGMGLSCKKQSPVMDLTEKSASAEPPLTSTDRFEKQNPVIEKAKTSSLLKKESKNFKKYRTRQQLFSPMKTLEESCINPRNWIIEEHSSSDEKSCTSDLDTPKDFSNQKTSATRRELSETNFSEAVDSKDYRIEAALEQIGLLEDLLRQSQQMNSKKCFDQRENLKKVNYILEKILEDTKKGLPAAKIIEKILVQKRVLAETEILLHANLVHSYNDVAKDQINCLQVSPNGKFFLAGSNDSCLKMFDLRQKTLLHDFGAVHNGPIYAVGITPDSAQAATASRDQTLKIFCLSTKTLSHDFGQIHSGSITCLSITPCGTSIFTGSKDKTLKKFSLTQKTLLHNFGQTQPDLIRCTTVTKNNKWVLLGSAGGRLQMFSIQKNSLYHDFGPIHQDWVMGLACTRDS
jgi:hypothetical protein